jgi:hypothetical protein
VLVGGTGEIEDWFWVFVADCPEKSDIVWPSDWNGEMQRLRLKLPTLERLLLSVERCFIKVKYPVCWVSKQCKQPLLKLDPKQIQLNNILDGSIEQPAGPAVMDFVLLVELLDLPNADLSAELRVEQCCSLDQTEIAEFLQVQQETAFLLVQQLTNSSGSTT